MLIAKNKELQQSQFTYGKFFLKKQMFDAAKQEANNLITGAN